MNDDPSGAGTSGSERGDRREFLNRASRAALTAGLVGGYGGFAAIAARFLYPARPHDLMWQFVAPVGEIREGESISYRGPSGETLTITRQGRRRTSEDFIALSSTCPHLGCQVRWEPQNGRFFCPCHNGTFDPSGVATGGPPGEAGQSLPRYTLKVESGLLFIEVPAPRFAEEDPGQRTLVRLADAPRPGHDPCLESSDYRDRRRKV